MRLHTTILLTVTLIACSACASPSELWWGMFGQKIEEDVSALPDGVHTLHYSKSTPYPHWGGRKWGRGMVKDGEMTGPWTLYHPNGRKKLDTTYRNGEQHGLTTHYYGNGSIYSQGQMDRGSRVGEWQTYGYSAKFPDK